MIYAQFVYFSCHQSVSNVPSLWDGTMFPVNLGPLLTRRACSFTAVLRRKHRLSLDNSRFSLEPRFKTRDGNLLGSWIPRIYYGFHLMLHSTLPRSLKYTWAGPLNLDVAQMLAIRCNLTQHSYVSEFTAEKSLYFILHKILWNIK